MQAYSPLRYSGTTRHLWFNRERGLFQVLSPYCYPLFKVHKLIMMQILAKTIPPVRLVTSGTFGPTHRLGIFIENILNPVTHRYCQGELLKDNTEFLRHLEVENQKFTPALVKSSGPSIQLLATLDVNALYPNIIRPT